jgi:hypothetical protein
MKKAYLIVAIVALVGIGVFIAEKNKENMPQDINAVDITSKIISKGLSYEMCDVISEDKKLSATTRYTGTDIESVRPSNGKTELVITDLVTNEEKLVINVPNRSCAFKWVSSTIYLQINGYESVGDVIRVDSSTGKVSAVEEFNVNNFGNFLILQLKMVNKFAIQVLAIHSLLQRVVYRCLTSQRA